MYFHTPACIHGHVYSHIQIYTIYHTHSQINIIHTHTIHNLHSQTHVSMLHICCISLHKLRPLSQHEEVHIHDLSLQKRSWIQIRDTEILEKISSKETHIFHINYSLDTSKLPLIHIPNVVFFYYYFKFFCK